MRTFTHNAGAGSSVRFHEVGSYFHLLETVSAVDVNFYKRGAIFAEAKGMEGGFFSSPKGGFDSIEIVSAGAQAVKFAISDGTGGYNRTTGAVQVSNTGGAFTHAQASVTNADNTILAANANRRYCLIQNNSAAGVLRLVLDGTIATTAKGIRLQPGASYEVPSYCMTNAIRACMETADATANNVEVVAG